MMKLIIKGGKFLLHTHVFDNSALIPNRLPSPLETQRTVLVKRSYFWKSINSIYQAKNQKGKALSFTCRLIATRGKWKFEIMYPPFSGPFSSFSADFHYFYDNVFFKIKLVEYKVNDKKNEFLANFFKLT